MHPFRTIQDLNITPYGELDLTGWNSTDPIFAKLIEKIRPTTIFEIGTWKGASAVHMCKCAIRAGIDMSQFRIYCVDTWLGSEEHWTSEEWRADLKLVDGFPSIYYTFLENMLLSGVAQYIIPVPLPSTIAHRLFKKYKLNADLIYIDGDHQHTSVLADIHNYWPHINPGGSILFDDFTDPNWPGVEAAVRSHFPNDRIQVEGMKAWVESI